MNSFGGPDARERTLAEIGRYSMSEAASLVGALCLIPQNLHRLGRLESIAHCCLASVPRGSVAANRTNVGRLLAAADRCLFERVFLKMIGYAGQYVDRTALGYPARHIDEPCAGDA